jgi:predicted RNA-binding protein with RPS1 domain
VATTNVVAIFDASDIKKGFKEFEQGMNNAKKGGRELGGVISNLSDVGGATGKALGSLFSGLATGGPIGLAIAGVQVLVDAFKEMRAEAAKAGEEFKKMLDDLKKSASEAAEQLAKLQLKNAGGTGAMEYMRAEVEPIRAKVTATERYLAQLREELKLWQDKKAYVNGVLDQENIVHTRSIEDAQALVQNTERQLKAERDVLNIRQKVANELVEGETQEATKKSAEAKERADKDRTAKEKKLSEDFSKWLETKSAEQAQKDLDLQIAAARASSNERLAIELEYQKELLRIEVEYANTKKQLGIGAPSGKLNQGVGNVAMLVNEINDKQLAYEAYAQKSSKLDQKESPMFGPGSPLGEAEWEMFSEKAKKAKDEIDKISASYQRWGEIGGQVIGGLITGQITLGQAFAQLGQMIIKTVIDMAIKQVTADAATAAAGAASSQAGIPIVGPVLAIAAMGAMMSAVLGLLSSIPGKALGGPVTFGQPYVVGEVGPELFIPGSSGNIVPNSALGGRQSTTNVFISALDAKSFERSLRDNEGILMEGINDAMRRGRY